MKKQFSFFVISFIIILLSGFNTSFAEKTSDSASNVSEYIPQEYTPHSTSLLATDLNSGVVLYEKNSDLRFSPGSLTRILTAMVAIENCDDLNAEVTVPNNILDGFDYDNYNIGLKYGEKLSIKNLIEAMLIHDAGDCAIVLGHTILDSDSTFIKQMNTIASKVGAENTYFADASGFDTKASYTTLRDMSLITKYALENETFANIVSKEMIEIAPTNKCNDKRILYNTNNFISIYYSNKYFNSAIKGVKNYYNNSEDLGAIAYYSRNKDELLLLCAKSDTDGETNYAYKDIDYLIDYSMENFTNVAVVKKDEFLSEVKINNGENTNRILLVSDSELLYKLPVDYDKSKIEKKITTNETIKAPISKGDVLGKTEVFYDGTKCGEVNLVAYQSVDSDFLSYAKHIFLSVVTSGYFITIIILLILLFVVRTININRRKKK